MDALESLRSHPWFSKLSLEQFAALMAVATRELFPAGETVIQQGDLGNRFFAIERGAIALHRTDPNGVDAPVGIIPTTQTEKADTPPVNYFGEQMFTTQEPFDFRAVALVEIEVFVITRQDFNTLITARPELLAALPFMAAAEKKRRHGFDWVIEGETVVRVERKAWWSLLPSALPIVLLAAAVFLIDFLADIFFHFDLLNWVLLPVGLLLVGWLVFVIYDWRNDEYVITNQRVGHVERVFGFLQELRKSVPLEKILGVRTDTAVPAIWFGVGTVVIQTAGREGGDIIFAHVSHPDTLRKEILGQKDRVRARQVAQERESFRAGIRNQLASYIAPQLVPPPAPPPPPAPVQRDSLWTTLRRLIRSWLSLELVEADRVIWRKHWVLLVQTTWRPFALLVLLDFVFISYALNPTLRILSGGAFVLGGLVAFSISFGILLYHWIDWRNDIYMVTNTQIVHEEKLPFNLKSVSDIAPLDQVQDIRVEITSPLASVFDYGNLIVETAAKAGQMVFEKIHNPRHAQEEVFRRIQEYKIRRVKQDAELQHRSVIDALVAYHHLQQQASAAPIQPPASPPASTEPPEISTNLSNPPTDPNA